ncbi:MAG: hypothetical protein R2712_23880 [Vicinamibacterales bacterium]
MERGTVDCVIVGDEVATVLEFKTGGPRPGHARQLEAYVEAMRGCYPGRRVDGRLIYAGSG